MDAVYPWWWQAVQFGTVCGKNRATREAKWCRMVQFWKMDFKVQVPIHSVLRETVERNLSLSVIHTLSAILFPLFPICPEKWEVLTSAKTRLLKGFYNFSLRVYETHERPRQAADFAGIILRIGQNSEFFCRFRRSPGETSEFLWYSYPDWSIEITNTRLFKPFFRVSVSRPLSAFSSWVNQNYPQNTPYCNWEGIHITNSIFSNEGLFWKKSPR